MSMFIITFQFAVCDMSVDLRCRKRLMSQQFFHTVDAGSVVEHHRRIRVAERVGRTPPTGNLDQLVIDRRAFCGQEEGIVAGCRQLCPQRPVQFYQ